MIITLKINLEKSGTIFRDLMNNEGVEIIEIRSNTEPTIVVGPWKTPDKINVINDILTSLEVRNTSHFDDFPNLPKPLSIEIGDIDIFHYAGWNSSWFIHILSLTCRKVKFCYQDSILMWMSRIYYQTLSKPFIRQLFYRKCFMVLKDFRNIRRCYNF